VSACVLGVASALVTIVVNVPINQQIAGWNPSSLPVGYEEVLRRWWSWHIVRLLTSVGAMGLVFSALLTRDRPS
jgi:uncharacterized membrane protein